MEKRKVSYESPEVKTVCFLDESNADIITKSPLSFDSYIGNGYDDKEWE